MKNLPNYFIIKYEKKLQIKQTRTTNNEKSDDFDKTIFLKAILFSDPLLMTFQFFLSN